MKTIWTVIKRIPYRIGEDERIATFASVTDAEHHRFALEKEHASKHPAPAMVVGDATLIDPYRARFIVEEDKVLESLAELEPWRLEQLRKTALSRLTDEERKALGV